MLFVTHALAGAAAGIISGNPLLGFGLGVASHHILDSIPHFDQGSFYIDEIKGPGWAGVTYETNKMVKIFKVKRDWAVLFLDWAVAVVIFFFIFSNLPLQYWILIIAGAAGGIMPDILDVSPLWKDKFRNTFLGGIYHKFHDFFHWPLTWRLWYIGLGIQVAVVAVAVLLIKKFFI